MSAISLRRLMMSSAWAAAFAGCSAAGWPAEAASAPFPASAAGAGSVLCGCDAPSAVIE
jgi:hypothetical protein